MIHWAIQDWPEDLEQTDFGDVWMRWREMNRNGIEEYSDSEIRRLFAQLSTLAAQAEIQRGLAEAKFKTLEVHRDTKLSHLIAIVYDTGAMNLRKVQAESDDAYVKLANDCSDAEGEFIIWKSRSSAANIAAGALSRELSSRIAK